MPIAYRRLVITRPTLTPTLKPAITMIAAAVVLLGPAAADAAPDDRNSATWYRRSFERLGAVSNEDWDKLYPYWENPTGPPPPGVRDLMARLRPAFDQFRRGSMEEFTDFELAYEDGIDMRLPHLAQLRMISKLMRYDLLVRLHDGDTAAAAEHVATLYRMSQQLSADRTLISTLVGQAVFSLADDMATNGFDRGAFNAADSEVLLTALEPLTMSDPFGVIPALGGERDFFAEWLAEKYATADARAMIMEEMPWMDAERAGPLGTMSDEEFAGHVEGYRQLIGSVQAAMAIEPRDAARAELARIEAAVEAGEYGVLVTVLAPSFMRALDRMEMTEEMIAKRLEMLRDVTSGRKPLTELTNAAFFYIRAAEAARRMDAESPDELQAFRVFERGAEGELDEELSTVLDEAETILALMAEGASKERCDFEAVGPSVWLHLAPAPLPGLCDAVRFLHADTRRLIRVGDVDAAVTRLATCYALSGHLSTHESLLAAMLAHTTFLQTQELVERDLTRAGCSEEHRVVLLEAARRIPRADPFGYTRSVVEARKSVSSWLYYQAQRPPGNAELQQQISVAVEPWDADRLLFIESVHFQLERAGEPAGDAASVGVDPLRPLADLIAPDAMRQVADNLGPTASAIRLGEIEILEATLVPPIAWVAERQRTAGRDLKRGLRFLEGR